MNEGKQKTGSKTGKVLAWTGGGILALAAAAGIAQGTGHPGFGPHGRGMGGDHFFQTLDANHDGTVTQAEIASFTSNRVKEFDTNRDGQITRAEYDAARMAKREERQQAMFKRVDANGDGVISADEFKNARASRWSKHHNGGAQPPAADG